MTLRLITILGWLLVISTGADARTSGDLHRLCLARNPWASAACDKEISTIFRELKAAGMKCDATDGSANDISRAVFDYMRANPEVHSKPAIEVVKEALHLTFRCE